MFHRFRQVLLAVVALGLLAGCVGGTTPPSRYYLLAADPALAELPGVRAAPGLSAAVGPVVVPGYLKRTEIVTNKTPYQIELAEFDIWAEPLDQNLARVLVANLSRLLGSDEIMTFAERRGSAVDFEVAVDVERMDATADGAAELVVRWTVIRPRDRAHLFTRRSQMRSPLAGDGFETLAAAMSRNVAALSSEIATALGQFGR